MNKEVQQIIDLLAQGKKPSVADLEAKGYSSEALKAVMARGDVLSVKTIGLSNGSEVTRLVLDGAVASE